MKQTLFLQNYEALNLVTNFIQRCSDQSGYEMYRNHEDLLLKRAYNEDHSKEFQSVMYFYLYFYKDDFIPSTLKLYLEIFYTSFNHTKTKPELMLSDLQISLYKHH